MQCIQGDLCMQDNTASNGFAICYLCVSHSMAACINGRLRQGLGSHSKDAATVHANVFTISIGSGMIALHFCQMGKYEVMILMHTKTVQNLPVESMNWKTILLVILLQKEGMK